MVKRSSRKTDECSLIKESNYNGLIFTKPLGNYIQNGDDIENDLSFELDESQKNKSKKFGKRKNHHLNQIERLDYDLNFIYKKHLLAASIESILTQALTTNDKKLLDETLATKDLSVIRSTVAELPANYIEQLLKELVTRIQATPLRTNELGPWIREILRYHMIFCSTVPRIREILRTLQCYTKARLDTHEALVRYQGCVDTLTAICLRNAEMDEKKKHTFVSEYYIDQKPLLMYYVKDNQSEDSDDQETNESNPENDTFSADKESNFLTSSTSDDINSEYSLNDEKNMTTDDDSDFTDNEIHLNINKNNLIQTDDFNEDQFYYLQDDTDNDDSVQNDQDEE